ncbi:MAG: DUF4037 domain-containing protein [Promethearchaeota archaeon]
MGPLPQGDALWKDNWVDISILSYKNELREDWSLIKKWDASYNIIFFDPKEKIKDLLSRKDVYSSNEKFTYALKFFKECEHIGDFQTRQWIKRGDPLAANQMISLGISSLIGMIFLANDEYPPYNKWALNFSYSLKWLPSNWKEKISKIILTKEISLNEAKRRLRLFARLCKDCKEKIFGKEFRNTGFITISTTKELQFIINNSPVPIEKFAENFDIKNLSYEPIFEFTEITSEDNKRLITFNKEKFIKHKESNFPTILDWTRPLLHSLNIN